MNSIDTNLVWGEREAPYPNSLDYMFSLAVVFDLLVEPRRAFSVPLRATRDRRNEWDTFHVQDEPFLRTPNGIQHEVPRARLVFGRDALMIGDEGAVHVDGRLLLETDTPDRLSMRYLGVLKVPGGTQRFCAAPGSGAGPSGSLSVASTQDVVNPKYRWMVQNQLIGVGRMTSRAIAQPDGKASTWQLTFDFDFHIAS